MSWVTLLGDGAHLMTPFARVGVNLAMVDALKLAKTFVGYAGEKEKLFAAMREFEAEMFERAEQYAWKTWDNMHFSFQRQWGRGTCKNAEGTWDKESIDTASSDTASGELPKLRCTKERLHVNQNSSSQCSQQGLCSLGVNFVLKWPS